MRARTWRAAFVLGCIFAVVGGPGRPCWAGGSVPAAVTPPSEPAIRPSIGTRYPDDADHNGLADALENRAAQAAAQARVASTAAERQVAQAALNQMVTVELVFTAQITQPQINAFQALGGQIDYVYRSVSYGWNGQIPLGSVTALPAVLGASLVLVDEPKRLVLHLDLATQTGRVRPVWAAGFAGSTGGFDGDPNITIAIIDTGLDGTHTDLAGRQQFWKDYTSDGFATSRDLIQHGTHVTGIALGSGASAGSAAGTLFYTDSGDMSPVPPGSFYPSPIGLPALSLTFTSTAIWIGGGATDLYLFRQTAGGGGFIAQSAATSGASGITETNAFTPSTSRVYTAGLTSNGAMGEFVVTNSVTNFPAAGDGFNKLRGVAPACKWAGAKVFTDSGASISTWMGSAIDELVTTRVANNVKVINLSMGTIGDPGLDPTERQKVNTAVKNGIVVCVSAGNDGLNPTDAQRQIDDPGRAAMALTVAAGNDVNQLTDYTSVGFASPGSSAGQEEDYKPDLMAPGGSTGYYTGIMSVDSNTGDGASFTDQRANDYTQMQGTSMASPFAAGCAALVIDAMQQSGVTWSFASGQHSKYVKMVLCATATESNTTREGNTLNPTLQRAAAGPSGFPAGKDPYEGYGTINPDAAVEAVFLTIMPGASAGDNLGPSATARRAWARTVSLTAGTAFGASLVVPGTGDFDLYLYSGVPSSYGTPVLLASSTNAGSGAAESISYTPSASGTFLLVIKRVTGSGSFALSTTGSDTTAPTVAGATSSLANGSYTTDQVVDVRVQFSEPLVVTGTPQITLNTTPANRVVNFSALATTAATNDTMVFNYTVQAGDASSDLDYTSTSALVLNGGTIKDGTGNNANLTLPSPGAAGSLGGNKNIKIDTTVPLVANVTATNANGAYGAGSTIGVQIIFSEVVTVAGVPQLTLATIPIRTVNYTSGSGTPILLFNYLIQAGDMAADLDYASSTALALNGGTIKDAAGNIAVLTLPAPGAPSSLGFNKNIVIRAGIPGDYNNDGHVDGADLTHFLACALGPAIPQLDPACANAKFDADDDVDQADFGVWQRCYTGPNVPGNPNCAN